LQFYVSLGIGQHSSVAVTLDTVPLIALRTLTLAVSHILVDILDFLAPGLWTGRWNVPAVTLDTRAVFLIFLILTAAAILGVWACGPVSVALESPDSTPGTVVTFGLVAIARKSFAGESVLVVANSGAAHFGFFVAIFVHWPAALHSIVTLAAGTDFLAQIPPAGTLFILDRNGVFCKQFGAGLGSSPLALSLDASSLP